MGWFTARVPLPIPDLTDGTVRLRAYQETDLGRLVEEGNDPTTLAWMNIGPATEETARAYLASARAGWEAEQVHPRWAICTVDNDAYLGSIVLNPHAWVAGQCPAATVAYSLHPEGRGRGLMTRALRLAAREFFTSYGGQRLHWAAFRGNLKSWKVAWACGFSWHATIPQATLWNGELRDDWVASLGRDDDVATPKTPSLNFPEITTGELRLRAWRPDDVESLEPPDHPEHFLPHRAIPPLDGFESWRLTRIEHLMLGEGLSWCIAEAATDRALGYVTIFSRSGPISDFAELGYYLAPSARGRGIAATAASHAVEHAFRPSSEGGLGIRRLVATTTADNHGSNHTLRRVGFTEFGREREVDLIDSGPVDLIHWELLG